MGKQGGFRVRVSGLGQGTHRFGFVADESFFEGMEGSLIPGGKVEATLDLDRKSSHMELHLSLQGEVECVCDRCAIAYRQPVSGQHRLYVKFGEREEADDDDLIVIAHGEHELDLTQALYELICLALPLRMVPCEETADTSLCDTEVLSRINGTAEDAEEPTSNPFKDILGGLNDRLN